MSRRARPASFYIALAERLARTSKVFEKYTSQEARDRLTPAQKSAIAKQAYAKGFAKPLQKRSDRSYVESARKIAHLVPSMKKYAKQHLKTARLTPSQKAAIAHKENLLRYAHHLIPVKGKTARELKDELFAPGINAIQLDHTNDTAKLIRVRKGLMLTNNGEQWLYWRLNAAPRNMKRGAEKAFGDLRAAFPMERIAALVKKAFDHSRASQVHMWTTQGRVGEGFRSLKQFLRWFNRAYGGYSETHKWVRGVAILLGTKKSGAPKQDDDFEDEYDEDEMEDDE